VAREVRAPGVGSAEARRRRPHGTTPGGAL